MNKSSICFERTNAFRKEQKLFPKSLKYVTDPLTVAGEANILVTNTGSVGLKTNDKFTKTDWTFGL